MWYVGSKTDLPWPVMVCAGVVAAALGAVIMERVAFRPLRGATPVVLLIASFAVSYVLQNVFLVAFGSSSLPIPEIFAGAVSVGSLQFANITLVALAVNLALLGATAVFLKRTNLGIQMLAAAEDFTMARILGVRANRVIAIAFAISGALAGVVSVVLLAQTESSTQPWCPAASYRVRRCCARRNGKPSGSSVGWVRVGGAYDRASGDAASRVAAFSGRGSLWSGHPHTLGSPARTPWRDYPRTDGLMIRHFRIASVWPAALPVIVLGLLVTAVTLWGSIVVQRVVINMLFSLVLAVGLYVFTGNSGVISFGHMSFMAVAAYLTAYLTAPEATKRLLFEFPSFLTFIYDLELNPIVAVILIALMVGVLGLVAGSLLIRLSGIEAAIATLAGLLVVNVVLGNWDSMTGGLSVVFGTPQVLTLGSGFVAASICIAVAFWYQSSAAGRRLRASREDVNAATALGINVRRERLLAFGLSAAIVAVGGALYAFSSAGFAPNDFFLERTFLIIAMLVFGGMFSLGGTVFGVIIVSVLAEVLRQLAAGVIIGGYRIEMGSGWPEIILGVLILVVLILRPAGLIGSSEIQWPFRPQPLPVPNDLNHWVTSNAEDTSANSVEGDPGDNERTSGRKR